MNSLGFEGKIYQRYLWIYIASPFLGGIIASLFMRFVHNPNLGITGMNKSLEEDNSHIEDQSDSLNSDEREDEYGVGDGQYNKNNKGRGAAARDQHNEVDPRSHQRDDRAA